MLVDVIIVVNLIVHNLNERGKKTKIDKLLKLKNGRVRKSVRGRRGMQYENARFRRQPNRHEAYERHDWR